jgi:O-antigen ligase
MNEPDAGTALRWPARWLAWLTAALAFASVPIELETWLSSAESGLALSPGSPGCLWVVGVALLGLGLAAAAWRRPLIACAAGLLCAAFAGLAPELPDRALNVQFGNGPVQLPLYGLFSLAGLAGLALAWRRERSALALLLVLLWIATANGKLYAREQAAPYHWLLAGSLTLVAALPRPTKPRDLAAAALWIGLALLGWVALAALFGDSPGRGGRVVLRLGTGMLLALALAGAARERGPQRLLLAGLLGLAAALLLQGAGLVEAGRDEGLERVFASRWRLFGMHPNGSAPLFAIGLCLAAGAACAARGARRVGLAILALLAGLCLWRSQSAASEGGAALGLLALLLGLAGRWPRRAATLPVAALLLLLGGLGVWFSPLGERVEERLIASAQGPSALGQRYHFWRMSAAAIADAPLVGQGPNQYYPHARFAAPSYYDGTPQDLHPHNLALALAEGAGLPALALFTALTLLTLEAGRRRLRAAADFRERAPIAALLGALIAVLGSNSLDLGQSQQTWIPLWSWLCLGALLPPVPSGAARRPLGGGLALAAWFPLVLAPVAAEHLTARGTALMSRAELPAARAHARLAQRLAPADIAPLQLELQVARRSAGPQQVLEVARRMVAATPGRAAGQLALAEACLDAGRLQEVERALALAERLDPRGPDAAARDELALELELRRGRLPKAEQHLRSALVHQGSPWQRLELARETGRFQLRARGSAVGLDLGAALAELEAECLALAEPRPVESRRMARGIHDAWRELRELRRAADFLATQRARSAAPFASLLYLECELWIDIGDLGRAAELERLLAGADARMAQWIRLALAVERRDAAAAEQIRADLFSSVSSFDDWDLFFEAGQLRRQLERWYGLCLLLGDSSAAERALRRALRDISATFARRQSAERAALNAARSSLEPAAVARLMRLALAEFDLPVARREGPAALDGLLQGLSNLPDERRLALLSALEPIARGPAARALLARSR